MASVFGHVLASASLTKTFSCRKLPFKFWVLALASGAMPDLDVIAFRFGIPYQSAMGHRGFTHSISFAFIWAGLLTGLFFRKESGRITILLLLFISTLSHGILDAMTNGGLGGGFFIPFNHQRYFFPFHPIEVSPIKVNRFFDQASRILISEAVWIGVPCFVLLGAASFVKKIFACRGRGAK